LARLVVPQRGSLELKRPATCSPRSGWSMQRLGGHSLRAGFVTEAFRRGADAHAIMRQTGTGPR
jgi:hypothetical protein